MIRGRFDPTMFERITPPDPVGAYERGKVRNGFGSLSGQFPLLEGTLIYKGRVGAEVSEEQGIEAAFVAASNVLAQLSRVIGGFNRLDGLLRLDGYVASAPGYLRQPEILDVASELFVHVLGEKGRHSRTAISVEQLPLWAPVELAVTFAVERS